MTSTLDAAVPGHALHSPRASRRAIASGVLPAALLLSVALGGSAQAAEPAVTCGSTVTTDVTLTADLSCPSGEGLILGSNVTLDLGGHRLIGSGTGTGVQTSSLSEGGNTIRNGTIENWGGGIQVWGERPSRTPYLVTDVVVINASIVNSSRGTILQLTRLTAVDSRIVGDINGSLAISDSSLTRSPVGVSYAFATIVDSTLVQSHVNTTDRGQIVIDSSTLDGKGAGSPGSMSETGIIITDSVVKNFAEPISGFWGGVHLIGNKFSDMPNGVLGDVSYFASEGVSIIRDNTFIRTGVALRGNVPMVVENNTFKHGDVAVEFTRPDRPPGSPPYTAEGSRAVGNVIMNHTGSGITTELAGVEVAGNTAKNNGGYGIYAPGAVDLGGNVAFNNDLGQCVGVVCDRK